MPFPISNSTASATFIAEGDYVVGRWAGGGTHTGPAFSDFRIGSLPAASGRKMTFRGHDRAAAGAEADRGGTGTGRCVERHAPDRPHPNARTGDAGGKARGLAAAPGPE